MKKYEEIELIKKMYIYENKTCKEIAEEFGRPMKSIKKMIERRHISKEGYRLYKLEDNMELLKNYKEPIDYISTKYIQNDPNYEKINEEYCIYKGKIYRTTNNSNIKEKMKKALLSKKRNSKIQKENLI